jgi:soluble lytic murein transglycosylase-like protein
MRAMPHFSALLRGPARALMLGAACTAVVSVLHRGQPDPAEGLGAAPLPQAAAENLTTVPPRSWAVRAGGWYIRVDGADIAIPAAARQTAVGPRTGVPATTQGLDWRLIAAVIYEESRFNPTACSAKGACGLMQVRPVAAEAVGARRFLSPDDNVKTGIRYLRYLDEMFPDAEGSDRLSLVLAAYNMGPAHVRDAQVLARRFGYDPNRWEGAMAVMLPLLEQPPFFRQLPSGFANGRQTVAYVRRILERYQRYKSAISIAPPRRAQELSPSASYSTTG